MKGVILVVGIVLAMICGVVTGLLLMNRPAGGIPEDGVLFAVEHGETVGRISARLEQAGLVRSGLFLRVVARLKGTEEQFKAGYYRIRPTYDTMAVHDLFVEGKQDQVTVTIPEGWTAGRIAAYLEDKRIAMRADFLAAASSADILARFGIPGETLEGYLFPDTYYLSQNMPAELIVAEMVSNFFRRLEALEPSYQSRGSKGLHEAVIMASIVEREYRVDEEAPYIASVFYNRLKRGIGLESCATVAYIITEIQGKPYPQTLTKEDTAIDSPYNTYKWAGYPPGPISNPGTVALAAAFHPVKTDYYYFVVKDSDKGTHYFSRDLEEHNRAKGFYLKGIGAGR